MSLFDVPSAGDLTDMIATMTASLPDTVNVLRNAPTNDGQGGQTESWGTAFASAARRSDLNRDEEQLIASRLTATTGYAVLLPAASAVHQSDRIAFTDGTTVEIIGFASNTWELVQRCLCVVVGGS